MHGAQNTYLNGCILSTKNAHAPVHVRLCNGAELLCHGSYCNLILSLARASYRLSFAVRPAAVSLKSVAQHCSLKKFVQIHASSWRGRRCGVAQASFDHLRWYRPHPVCLWFALKTWPRAHFIKNSICAIFYARVYLLLHFWAYCVGKCVTSCERVQYRVLRKWLWTDFEQSLQCGSLTEPDPCAAGDLFLESSDNIIACRTRSLRDFWAFFCLISDPRKRGFHVTFVWWWIHLRPCEWVCVWINIFCSKYE